MKFAAAYFTTNIVRKLGYWLRPRCFPRSCPSTTAAILFWRPSSNRDSLPARWSASKAAPAMLTRACNWRVPIYDRLFAEVEFGGALNDSEKGQPGWLGCPVTFRESGGLGVQITSNIDVVGSIEHVSHADLCGHTNPGLSSFGLRVGYKF